MRRLSFGSKENEAGSPLCRRILCLFCAALALSTNLISTASAASTGCQPDPAWAELQPDFEADVLGLTNAHRSDLGLDPVTASTTLTAAAQWKAAHMANFQYMEHDDPDGRDWYQRLKDCGYTSGAGENIAYGYKTPQVVFDAWLSSDGHRRNIEDPDFKAIGVGAAIGQSGRVYWAQDFGTRVDKAVVPVPAESAEPTEPNPNLGLQAERDDIDVEEDDTVSIDALANDHGSGMVGIISFGQPRHGEVTQLGDELVYRPNEDFNGSDSFRYTIGSETGQLSTAVIDLTVLPRNDAPIASDDVLIVRPYRAAIASVLDNDIDVDGDDLSLRLRDRGAFGTVRLDATRGIISYRPGKGSAGRMELISYWVYDPDGGRDNGLIRIRIRRG